MSEVAYGQHASFSGDIDKRCHSASHWYSGWSSLLNCSTVMRRPRCKESDYGTHHYHDPRAANWRYCDSPRHRGAHALIPCNDCARYPLCATDPEKDCRCRETNLPDAGNMLDKQNPCQQIADNGHVLIAGMVRAYSGLNFSMLRSGGHINNTAVMARLGKTGTFRL